MESVFSFLVSSVCLIMADFEADDTSGEKITFKKRTKFVKGFVRQSRAKPSVVEHSDDSDAGSSSEDETTVVRRDCGGRSNPLVQSTKSFKRARVKSKVEAKPDQKEDDSDRESLTVRYKSKRTAEPELPADMGATAIRQTETERDRDAQAIFERAQQINEQLENSGQKEDDLEQGSSEQYRGMNNYRQYIKKKDSALGNAASGLVRLGPVRAPEHIRSTVRWDYQPDICKDYKETGFCGFGDSCKFLHDRSDYKHGWQLELDVQRGTYGAEDDEDYEIKDEEQLPFKCLMCRRSFQKPVVTKCKHYFCEKCALDHFRQNKKCFVCGNPTQGIFNPAKEIMNRLQTANEDNQQESDSDDQSSLSISRNCGDDACDRGNHDHSPIASNSD